MRGGGGGGGNYGRGGGFPNRGGRGGGGGGVEQGWGRGFVRSGGQRGFSGDQQGSGDLYSEGHYSQYDEMGDMERYNDRLQQEADLEVGHTKSSWTGPGGQTTSQRPEDKPNDVEIICMDKSIRAYGEHVENRLKNMGLAVDILFPNPDIPLGSVLGNIATRGVMYAVCVYPENREHGSLTLNVLQGEQEEHRNMPVDDAMTFISQNFSNRLGELNLTLVNTVCV